MGTQRRIPVGPLIGLLGAVLLLVSLFLNWWNGVTAFTAFEVLDLLLAALAIGAAMSLAEAAGARMPAGVALGAALALPLGLLALLIVFSQIVNDPPAIAGSDRLSGHRPGSAVVFRTWPAHHRRRPLARHRAWLGASGSPLAGARSCARCAAGHARTPARVQA